MDRFNGSRLLGRGVTGSKQNKGMIKKVFGIKTNNLVQAIISWPFTIYAEICKVFIQPKNMGQLFNNLII